MAELGAESVASFSCVQVFPFFIHLCCSQRARWDPKSCTLEIIGFHDPRVYVVSLSVVKNKFVLVGDAYGSVQVTIIATWPCFTRYVVQS